MKHFLSLLLVLFHFTNCIQAVVPSVPSVRVEKEVTVRLPRLAIDSLKEAAQKQTGTYAFAQGFPVEYPLGERGAMTGKSDGSVVRSVEFTCENATSMGVLFSRLSLEEGDTLYLVSENDFLGPITKSSGFVTENVLLPFLQGNRLIVEFKTRNRGSLRSVVIGTVGSSFRALPNGNSMSEDVCSLHAASHPLLSKVKQSVCALIYYEDYSFYYASGSLINNTSGDGTPYVLTAEHTIGSEAVAKTSVAFFNYESPHGRSDIRGPMEFFIPGSTLISFNSNLDLSLLRLPSLPRRDFRPYMAGWSRESSPHAPFYGIHHPSGTCKRVSIENDAISPQTLEVEGYTYAPYAHWNVKRWDVGTTEGGSSGSPLLDSNLRIVGALTSGSSTCLSPVSDDYYRLSVAWDYSSAPAAQLKYWLDPTSSNVTVLDGTDPYEEDSVYRQSPITPEEAEGATSLSIPERATLIAQHYVTSKDAYLHGIHFISANSKLPTRIYLYKGGLDDAHLIHEEAIGIPSLAQWKSDQFVYSSKSYGITNGETYIRLSDSIDVGRDFYVAYSTESGYQPYASIASEGSAYILTDGEWVSLGEADATHNALWMDVTLSRAKSATAVSDTDREHGVSVYPNPVDDRLIIRTGEGSRCSVEVYTLDGQRLKTRHYEAGEGETHTLATHDMAEGCYLVSVATENKVQRFKIVVSR